MNILILIIIFVIILLLIKYIYFDENIETLEQTSNISGRKNPIIFLDDPFFNNLVYYKNDENELGIDKCVKECDGNCVEFGVTGLAYCFSK